MTDVRCDSELGRDCAFVKSGLHNVPAALMTSRCWKATPPFSTSPHAGGLWKTVNQGTIFSTVFDNEVTASIGDIAIAPTDANLVGLALEKTTIAKVHRGVTRL